MNILYDGKIYDLQTAGGINRYFANIINRLPTDFAPTVTYTKPQTINFPSHSRLNTFFYKRSLFRPTRVCEWIEQKYFQSIATFKPFDLIHPTYYALLTRQDWNLCRIPIVLTVYDLIDEIFHAQDVERLAAKRQAILAARSIICISENTKQDLLTHYPMVDASKVTVTHLGSEIDDRFSYGDESIPQQPYFLFVGGRHGYKNFERLLKAFAQIAASEVKLCVVGSPFADWEQQQIADLGLSDRLIHYGQLTDTHLAKLYRCSVALVYPSQYEGFGIPPLEAMSCGTVAIASNCSSVPEVVGDAGLLIDPHSIADWVEAMKLVLNSAIERDRLIEKSKEQVRKFSWDQTAAQTVAVYRSAIA
jgi:glycosyltransferase involved in cell wall biosynthesis